MFILTFLASLFCTNSYGVSPDLKSDPGIVYKVLVYSATTNRFYRQVINLEKNIFNIEHCVLTQGSVSLPRIALQTDFLEKQVEKNPYQFACLMISPRWVQNSEDSRLEFNLDLATNLQNYIRQQRDGRDEALRNSLLLGALSLVAAAGTFAVTAVEATKLKTKILGYGIVSLALMAYGYYGYKSFLIAGDKLSSMEFATAVVSSQSAVQPREDFHGWPKQKSITAEQGNYLMDAVLFALKAALEENGFVENN